MRVIKEHEERRNEILDVAETLFTTKGYTQTTVNDILNTIGIAKGTFYYYFKSKQEVMDAIIERFVDASVVKAKEIMVNSQLTIHEKILNIFMSQRPENDFKDQMVEQFHQADNTQMHLKSLTELVYKLTSVLTVLVEQGIQEGLFKTPYPKESIEQILITGMFIFDDGIFHWEPQDMQKKLQAFIYMMEKTLGAEEGGFSYFTKIIN